MTHCCGLHLVEKESALTTFEATFTTALGGAAMFTNLFCQRCRKQRVMSVLSALCLQVSTGHYLLGLLRLTSNPCLPKWEIRACAMIWLFSAIVWSALYVDFLISHVSHVAEFFFAKKRILNTILKSWFWLSFVVSRPVLVMHKMQTVQGSTHFAKRVEPYRKVHLYKSEKKTFYNTLWFCILKSLKSLQNVLKSTQITPEVTKSMQTEGPPSPYFKWPFGRCFSF